MKPGWEVLESREFTIPFLPPSMNAVYEIIFAQRKVRMKPDVANWKTRAKEYIPKLVPSDKAPLFRIDATFYYDFYYQNGKMKKVDTQNLMKVLIDAIAEKNGFDDSYVKFGGWESYHVGDSNGKVEVVLRSGVGGEDHT